MKLHSSKVVLSIMLTVLLTSIAYSQAIVSGSVSDANYNPIKNAEVVIVGENGKTTTNEEGLFSIEVKEGQGVLEISSESFGTQTVPYNAKKNEKVDLGFITLQGEGVSLESLVVVGKGVIDISEDRKTPVASTTITKAEIQDLAQGNVDFTEAMANTPNVYVSNQSGGFGDSKMFTRGFDQSNTAFLFNGQPINGMEDGKMYWSNWSGMTDIANAIQIQRGLGSSKLAISSVGGTINIITKATEKKQGGFAQFTTANNSYFKGSIGYNSGLKGKWGYSIALSHWQANRNYARGTYGNGQNYFLSIGYKPNEHHLFNFIVTGAPQLHGQNFSKAIDGKLSYSTFGDKWNPNFGFKDGKQFSWRQNYYHKPIVNLNWDWTFNQQTSLSTVLYGSWGRGGGTGPLGKTKEPYGKKSKPMDYFRGGSDEYYNMENGDFLFDKVVAKNRLVAGGKGYYGNGVALRASVNNHNWFGLVSNFNTQLNDNISFNFGVDGRAYKGDHFRQLVDLLGLKSYEDSYGRDKSLGANIVSTTYEANPWSSLFNYAKEGERVAYDYSEKIRYVGAFTQLEYANDFLSTFFQGSISNQGYQRTGRWSDLGNSEKVSKLGYNVKAGASISANENNSFYINAGYYSRQPFLDNIFEDVGKSNVLIPNAENEKVTGLEAGYKFDTRLVKININLYYTEWSNRFINTGERDYKVKSTGKDYSEVNISYRGINQLHKGFEIDFKTRPTTYWKFNGYFTYGDWNYKGKTPYVVRDDQTRNTVDKGEVLLDHVKVGEAPQVSFGLESKLDFTRKLTWNVNMNYFGKFYEYVNLPRIAKTLRDGKEVDNIRLNNYVLFNTGLSYKIKISGKQDIRFRANVNNLFDKSYIGQKDGYGYFFGRGRTWNASVTYNF